MAATAAGAHPSRAANTNIGRSNAKGRKKTNLARHGLSTNSLVHANTRAEPCQTGVPDVPRGSRAPHREERDVKIAVVGAGAIGAFVGASLARAGEDVTLVARGEHLHAMRRSGVRVTSEHGDFTAHPAATNDIASVGTVDVVILALKAHQLGDVLDSLPALFDERTAVIAMQNGLPWWYFERLAGPFGGLRLESIDPAGRIASTIAAERAIGCVIYAAAEIVKPGVVRRIGISRFMLGELDGSMTPRLRAIAAACVAGGLDVPLDIDIRAEIWLKLLGNMSFNPISALTRATLVDIANDTLAESVAHEMMDECLAIVTRLGVELAATVDERIERARQVGSHKTSMLQDLEAGKPLEIDTMLGSIVELGALLDIPLPATRHVYALVKLLDRTTARTIS